MRLQLQTIPTVEENSSITVPDGEGESQTAATHAGSFAVHAQENDGSGISFSSDGKKMYITGHAQNKIHQWDLDDGNMGLMINLILQKKQI